jgi:hypothetical protein
LGLSAATADLTVTGCTIEPLEGQAPLDGVLLAGGSLVMSDSQIHGWVLGIEARPVIRLARPTTDPSQRATAIDELGSTANLALDHVNIVASGGGISYDGGLFGGRFNLRHSQVRSDAPGAISLFDMFMADFGTVADPGDNQIESASGVALNDYRTRAGAAIDAHGTTLNGNVHEGDALGPVQTADYQLMGPSTIHF